MTLKDFLEVLMRCRVTMLVDVRELAISRKPGFAKAAQSAALAQLDVKYEHLVELGCPRDVRHGYGLPPDNENRPMTGTRPGWKIVALENADPCPLLSNHPSTQTPLA